MQLAQGVYPRFLGRIGMDFENGGRGFGGQVREPVCRVTLVSNSVVFFRPAGRPAGIAKLFLFFRGEFFPR